MTLTTDDRSQIRDLVEGYAVLVDARDFVGVGALFTPDAHFIVPASPNYLTPVRSVAGRAAIQQELTQVGGFAVTFHSVCGLLVRPGSEQDRAEGWVNAIAHHVSVTEDGPRDLIWHLRYRDHYQRADSGWLLARRALTIDIVESRPIKRANDSRFEIGAETGEL